MRRATPAGAQNAACSSLLYAPHTIEGFSQQIRTLMIGVALAAVNNLTLVLTPEFSLTYHYVSWDGLKPAHRARIRRAGVSHFVDMAHLASLLNGTALQTTSFRSHTAQKCLDKLQSCTFMSYGGMSHPPASMPAWDDVDGLMSNWEWLVANALLSHDFKTACEFHAGHASDWRKGFQLMAQACFAKRERTLAWLDGATASQLPSGTQPNHVGSPTCIVGGAWAMERALPDSGRRLARELERVYRHPVRYAHAASRALPPTSKRASLTLHWRRGDAFLNNHPQQQGWKLRRLLQLAFKYAESCIPGWARSSADAGSSPPAYIMHDEGDELDRSMTKMDNRILPPVDAPALLGTDYVGSIDRLLIEEEVALQSTLFVGNPASGISRWIFDRRQAEGKHSVAVSSTGMGFVHPQDGAPLRCGHHGVKD